MPKFNGIIVRYRSGGVLIVPLIWTIIAPFIIPLVMIGFSLPFYQCLAVSSLLLCDNLIGLFSIRFLKIIPWANDWPLGVKKILLWSSLFMLFWFGRLLEIFPASSLGLYGLIILMLLWFIIKDDKKDLLFSLKKNDFFLSQALFFLILLLIIIFNAFHPEIYFGEKPMDYNLIQYFSRFPDIPPQDPWFAKKRLNYYYLGYFSLGSLKSMFGMELKWTYHLFLGLLAGWFSQMIMAICMALKVSRVKALWVALLLTLGSNWHSFYTGFFGDKALDINFFWKNTRVFNNGLFAEFPIWSFLFADIHPHVMAYPFALLGLFFIIRLWKGDELSFIEGFFLGFSLVTTFYINIWDALFYGSFMALGLISYLWRHRNKGLKYCYALFISMLVLLIPYFFTMSGGRSIEWGMHQKNLYDFSRWGYLLGQYIPLLIVGIFLKRKAIQLDQRYLLAGVLIWTFAIEFFYLMDPVNTIFKFGNQIFILLGVLSFSLLSFNSKLSRGKNWSIVGTGIFVSFLMLIGTGYNLKALFGHTYFGTSKPHLNGQEYFERLSPVDHEFVEFLNTRVKGLPLLLERYGRSFEPHLSRISSRTGLPVLLGWDGHIMVRGADIQIIHQRKKTIDFIYNSVDPIQVHQLLREKNISFLIIGPAERQEYESKGLAKFFAFSDLFRPLIINNGYGLFGIGNFETFLKGR